MGQFVGKWNLTVLFVSAAVGLVFGQANAASIDVPVNIRGVWGKHGRCDVRAERLIITAPMARWGKGPFGKVEYDPQFKDVHWIEEGVIDNFVIGRTTDVLVHNTQGFHMPGEAGYARCGPKLARVSWPPK